MTGPGAVVYSALTARATVAQITRAMEIDEHFEHVGLSVVDASNEEPRAPDTEALRP